MKVAVVCPFYNEEAIIGNAIRRLLDALASLEHDWELIVVNDGSKDASLELAKAAAGGDPRIRVLGYERNRGRGYALRFGIANTGADVVVTTEIDLSWGDDIVHRLIAAFEANPAADMIVASPNLPGGGYRNVPLARVLLSRLGNRIIRLGQSRAMTMYTGMTRAYRRERFLSLPIDEDEKEFHLEVAQKAQVFGFRIVEIPCVLEWRHDRLAASAGPKRKSSGRLGRLVRTHMAFATVAAPVRYILPVSLVVFVISLVFFVWAIVNLFNKDPSVFLLITSLVGFLIGFVVFAVGMLSYQGQLLQRDVWRLRRDLMVAETRIATEQNGRER